MSEFNEGQLKLAREVLGNFEAVCPRGSWVDSLGGENRDEDGNPSSMSIWESDGDYGVAKTHCISQEHICEAFVRILEEHIAGDRLEMVIRDMWDSGDYCGEMFSGGDFETDDTLVQVACFGQIVYG